VIDWALLMKVVVGRGEWMEGGTRVWFWFVWGFLCV